MHHPAVSLCAVVAKPDAKWGGVPCAFVGEIGGRGQRGRPDRALHALPGSNAPKLVVLPDCPRLLPEKSRNSELRAVAKLLDR